DGPGPRITRKAIVAMARRVAMMRLSSSNKAHPYILIRMWILYLISYILYLHPYILIRMSAHPYKSQTLMVHPHRTIRRKRYGTNFTRLRHHDGGSPSSNTK